MNKIRYVMDKIAWIGNINSNSYDSVEDLSDNVQSAKALSKWVNTAVMWLVRIKKLNGSVDTRVTSTSNIAKRMSSYLHNNSLISHIYTPPTPKTADILENRRSVSCSFWFPIKNEKLDFSHSIGASLHTVLYSLVFQMLHKTSSLIIIVYSISGQTGHHSFCDTSYSRGGVNPMWILKNS